MSQARAIALLLVTAGALLAGPGPQLRGRADSRPNVLFCLADDWSWPHAGAYGDKVVRTPTFDRVAREGVLFTRAFSAAPSCTPSRAHRLAEGGNLYGFLPGRFPVYPDLLEASGYQVGFTRKGWGPGSFEAGGRARNPAGPVYAEFGEFMKGISDGKPFCFWFGSHDPHRPYEKGSGSRSGMRLEDVRVPSFWPDTPEVRSDILDYYFGVQRFDREVGELLAGLEAAGKLDNTLVVLTGDNGWPFPRAKANLYDAGTRQPLAVRWPARVRGGRVLDDFVSLTDLAPTFLEAAGLEPPAEMTGRSFLGLLLGKEEPGRRNTVFVERERHANVRRGNLAYPSRAVRTGEFLFIRNLRPERWPAGDPELHFAVGPFGDCDGSPTKDYIVDHRGDAGIARLFRLGFEKRPAEELYDCKRDPDQVNNVAGDPRYAPELRKLRATLEQWMRDTGDPRATSDDDRWDNYPYFGEPAKPAPSTRRPGR
ncbi:MAG: heparan N-sulfatase [Acidobacteria bacterium]|nr:MAG: heparan N-sulfatase [Acidobacteriota bacterium]